MVKDLIQCINVHRHFDGAEKVSVLRGIDFSVKKGDTVSIVLEGDALLSFEDEFRSVTIRGMKPDLQSLEEVFSARLKEGSIRSFLNDEYGILIGHELAGSLGASI